MTTWAYECHSPDDTDEPWLVACMSVDAMPAKTTIVRVRIGSKWRCAIVDKRRRVEVAGMLLRDVVPSDELDCPECAEAAAPEPGNAAAAPAAPTAPAPTAASVAAAKSGRQVDAAAIAMQGHRFIVVLVSLDLVQSPGEADMAIADLRPRFGGAELVLMGQQEDGTPQYHGDAELLALLANVPVDKMPWKAYPLA